MTTGTEANDFEQPNDRDVGDQSVVTSQLHWEYADEILFDWTVMFGQGYDFEGLENHRREAKGPNGNYVMWPSNGKWSLYRDSDGALSFEYFGTECACERAAELWCLDVLSS